MGHHLDRKSSRIDSRSRIKKTPLQLKILMDIDSRILCRVLTGSVESGHPLGGWKGKCPFCSGIKSKHRHQKQRHRPAYLNPGDHNGYQEGYVFHCCACMTSLTTYKFLHQTQGLETAEQYAQTRWDAGQLCGEGWNCPIPQAVMIVLKQYQKLNLNLNEEQKQGNKRVQGIKASDR